MCRRHFREPQFVSSHIQSESGFDTCYWRSLHVSNCVHDVRLDYTHEQLWQRCPHVDFLFSLDLAYNSLKILCTHLTQGSYQLSLLHILVQITPFPRLESQLIVQDDTLLLSCVCPSGAGDGSVHHSHNSSSTYHQAKDVQFHIGECDSGQITIRIKGWRPTPPTVEQLLTHFR